MDREEFLSFLKFCAPLVGLAVVAMALIAIPVLGWQWYSAGVASRVLQRQGVQVTQWEVFVGAPIIDRNIRLEQAP